MEIKCKVEITLTEELMEALRINNDTIVIASVHDGVVTLEFENEDEQGNAVNESVDNIAVIYFAVGEM